MMEKEFEPECVSMERSKFLNKEFEKLNQAVDAFANEMKQRLHERAIKGKRGWDEPAVLSTDILRSDLLANATEMDMMGALRDHKSVDVANRAMMIWYRMVKDEAAEHEYEKGLLHG